MNPARILVGCSGWHYSDWRGSFYPPAMPPGRWLSHYCHTFDTVELNASFYRLPRETAVTHWRESVPENFVFAVKGSRSVTHVKRLVDTDEQVAALNTRVLGLERKLGPILWQLPPSLKRDDDRLARFVSSLPHTMRHVVEFRHPSWWHPDVYALLAGRAIALCIVDMPGFRSPVMATTDFIYMRFHGPRELYRGSYDDQALADRAAALADAAEGTRDVYAYFNNDCNAHAVGNALELRRLLASS